jgi:hypothetical protein
MKQIKFAILGAGIIGLIAVFLPFVSVGPFSASLWKLREAPGGSGQVFLTMGGFVVGAVMGVLAVTGKRLVRWQAIVSLIGFALSFIKVRDGLTGEGSAIGAKLLFIAALIGLIAAIAGTAKPEKA